MNNEFTITNFKFHEDYEGYGEAVSFTVITEKGSIEIVEWITDDRVETVDSNVRQNCIDELADRFDLSEKPGLMPVDDYIPLGAIFEAVQELLEKEGEQK